MNIFYTNANPELAARDLDDVRLNKMILETAQIISTVFRSLGSDHVALYKSTHENHPCTLWAGQTRANLDWLIKYLQALHNEWRFRRDDPFGVHHTHKSGAMVALFRQQFRRWSPEGEGWTEPPNCSRYPDHTNLIQAYRHTLAAKWLEDVGKDRAPTWNVRGRPLWVTDLGSMYR